MSPFPRMADLRKEAEFVEECRRVNPERTGRALELAATTIMDFRHAWNSEEASRTQGGD